MGFEQLAALRQQLTEQAEQERRARQKSSPDSDKQAAPEARTGKPAAPQGRHGKPGRPAPNAGKPGQADARSGKPAAPHAQGARAPTPAQDVDPVVMTISRLQRKFPKAFPKKPAAKVPLKLGVHEELLGQAEALGLPAEDITLAIKTWCQGARYWACLIENAARVSLDGEPVGVVTAVEAKRARQLAHRQRTGGAAKRKKPAAKPEQGAEGAEGAAGAAGEQDNSDVAAQPIAVNAPNQAGAKKADTKQTDSTQAVVVNAAGEAGDTTSAHESDAAAGSAPEAETASASALAHEAETASASSTASAPDSAPASESETSSVSGSETASVSKSETSSVSKTASAAVSASAPASVPASAAADEPDALAVMAANTPTDDTASQSVASAVTDDSEFRKG